METLAFFQQQSSTYLIKRNKREIKPCYQCRGTHSGHATLSLITLHVLHPSSLPPLPSANFSLLLKPWVWVLNCPCPSPSSDRPVVNLGNHSKPKKIRILKRSIFPPPHSHRKMFNLILDSFVHLHISCPPQLKRTNTWNWYFSNMFYVPSSVDFFCNWCL